MTTPTPGNTTVAQGSSGGILSDIGNFFKNDTVIGALSAPAVSTYEGLKTGVTDTASATAAVAEVTIQGAEWVANPHNWLRVCMVIGGSVIVILGVYLAFKNTSAGQATGSAVKGGARLAAVA